MATYTIKPNAPGQPDSRFKVFADGIKMATLSVEQVRAAWKEHHEHRYAVLIQYPDGDVFIDDLGIDGAENAQHAMFLAKKRAKELSGIEVRVLACFHERPDTLWMNN